MSVLDQFDLTGRVSIVTGAAMGLGKAMAKSLAEAGSAIVIVDINEKVAKETVTEIKKKGVDAVFIHGDVTSPDDAERVAEEVTDTFQRVDVLVNNAGICLHEDAENVSYKDWLKVIDVNLNGVFLMSQAIGRVMISQQHGNIINIASMSGLIVNTPQNQASYNASKAGVIMLTKSLAAEWIGHNVRVNAIAPGYMKTEMTRPIFDGEQSPEWAGRWMEMSPMKRPGEPQELGGLVVYLASDASSFMTGHTAVIDGGYTLW
jgi:NAD(P)-dependent dehydrogenase (short-subunit alcohol dehydrogenase family)